MTIERHEPTRELFGFADISAQESERIEGPPVGFWKDSWVRLKKNRGALISLAFLAILFLIAFSVGPLVSSHSPYDQYMTQRYLGLTSDTAERLEPSLRCTIGADHRELDSCVIDGCN